VSRSLSVVVPVNHGLHFLKRCLNSVRDSLPDHEIILVENGSKQISNLMAKELTETNVRTYWLEEPNKSKARNFGAEKARNDLITFLDQDDELLRAISTSLSIFNSIEVDGVISAQRILSQEEKYIPPYIKKAQSLNSVLYHPMTLILRRVTFFEVGGFDSLLSKAEDFDLIARLVNSKKVLRYNPNETLKRHFHESNDSRDISQARKELFMVLRNSSSSITNEKAN